MFSLSATGKVLLILPVIRVLLSAVGKKKKKKKFVDCQCQKHASLLSCQLLPFPSIVLTVLKKDDAGNGKTCETTEYKLSKAVTGYTKLLLRYIFCIACLGGSCM